MDTSSPLFWLLGTDEDGQWHQRIIQARSLAQADAWWRVTLERDAEIAIAQDTLEGGVGALVALEDALLQAQAGRLFGAWVAREDRLDLVPVVADDTEQATQHLLALNPGAQVRAVVDARPLLDTLARMRAIAAGQRQADEVLA